jgi:GT2 family glycosyltransferase
LAFRLTHLWRDGRGRAAACNAGLAAATGAVVVFLDDDMEPAPTWLAAHLVAHAGPAPVAVVGSAPSAVPPPSSPAGRYFARRFDRHLAKLATAADLTFRDVYTGNASIPRAALIGVGGYDESFAAYGNEDGDLAIRLDEAGVPWRFDADALAWQHQDKDLAAAFSDARAKGRTAVLLASRHPAQASLLRLGRPGSLPRRTIRNLLLGMTRLAPVTQTAILRAVGLLERVGPPGLDRLYDVVFDYGYWLGVRSARSSDSPVPGLP